ncbi:MAG: cation-translocating P-type ATPase [Hydrogenibacillus sp.]|nr:cation-translocating P-type ATPase [Hydrogenibacillus sp.]
MAEWYAREEDEVLRALGADAEKGLSSEDARRRTETFGLNQIEAEAGGGPLQVLLAQFQDFMIVVLLAATLISALLGEIVDAVAILAIVILNGFLGFIQEYRAERALEALSRLSAPKAEVLRDGAWHKIEADKLVPGDIVRMSAGARVPADVRLLQTTTFIVDESALTGESVPLEKRAPEVLAAPRPLGDQTNMAFMGTLVLKGEAAGVVVFTGMQTEMGKIAHLLKMTEDHDTPLKRRMRHLGKVLVWVAVALTAVVTVLGVMSGYPFPQMFLIGVTLAVAAIPEGLPTIVTIVLAIGVSRIERRKAIVRRLPSVETLGSTTFICTDKTGTLTMNRMTLAAAYTTDGTVYVSGSGYEPVGDFYADAAHSRPVSPSTRPTLMRLLAFGAMSCEAKLVAPADASKGTEAWSIDGDPTEGAIVVAAHKSGLDAEALRRRFPRAGVLPFDSTRKRMSVVYALTDDLSYGNLALESGGSGQRGILVTKGAFEVVLARATAVYDGRGVRPLTPRWRARIAEQAEAMAASGMRVLAVAYREDQLRVLQNLEDERDLVFVGLVGLIDPPRPEVPEAIRTVQEASIRVAMITGDHRSTARAIAETVGILRPEGLVLSGEDLKRMDETALVEAAPKTDVYARVTPEDKLRIVQALRSGGHIVAMTGDGTNDAPALKAADIGVAMGQNGTEVAKEAADLILLDDNFTTIEAAIEEGRTIYENIRKFVRYLLASNVAEIMVMLIAVAAGLPVPLTPLMILWINLVTDGLPALALGLDGMERDLMKQPPRPPSESIFARGLWWKILSRGAIITAVTLYAFSERLKSGVPLAEAQTAAFVTLIVAQLIHVYDARSERSIFHRNPLENLPLLFSVLFSFALVVGVIVWEPAARVFGTTPLSGEDWVKALGIAVLPFFLLGGVRVMFARFRTGRG